MSAEIHFHKIDVSYRIRTVKSLKKWIEKSILDEKQTPGTLNFILCSDDYLLGINRKYLKHDFYTDIITFDYSDDQNISGDIFISIDRVKENARKYSVKISDELHRVIIHGVLHLLGYNDKSPGEQSEMKAKEDFYLSLRAFS